MLPLPQRVIQTSKVILSATASSYSHSPSGVISPPAGTDPTSPPTPFTTSDAGIEKRIGVEPRIVWTVTALAKVKAALDERVAACRDPASAPATWLETVVPDGLNLPERRRRHPHTSSTPSSAPSSRDPSLEPQRVRVLPATSRSCGSSTPLSSRSAKCRPAAARLHQDVNYDAMLDGMSVAR